jgi:hypothetical protein
MIDANYQLLVKGAAVSESNPLPSADADVKTEVQTLQTQVTALTALVGTAADAAGANTLIGQLKQIAANTTPAG